MARFFSCLICLPVCLCMAPNYPEDSPAAKSAGPHEDVVKDDGSALPTAKEMDVLAEKDVLRFMEQSLRRYAREVKGYSGTFQKQEFVKGKLYPTEVMAIRFRETPHSVYMEWKKGTQQAERVLYVEGENDDKLLARPAGALARTVVGDVVSRDVEGPDARAGNRYTLKEFGLKRTTERTLVDWRAARKEGDFQVEYQGKKKVKEAGDRLCYAFHRTCKKPDRAGVADALMFFDAETWLQVGTVLKDEKGNLLGSYFFRDLELNPEFKPEEFQKAALKP